ncbi:Glucose-repressible alcohol dehydrogenase transcriptional effector [Kappamyces sp. JEL0680]|nr:Glucose-repressible alcohol dehydrogenase transcriptional effector [Kappamyces sp. JEL0680]
MSNGYLNHLYANSGAARVGVPLSMYGKPGGPMLQHPSQMMYNVLQGQPAGNMGTIGPHHTKQLEGAQRARMAGTQAHHHARIAASQQRLSNNLNGSSGGGNPSISILTQSQTVVQGSQSDLSGNIPVLKPKNLTETSSWTALDMGGMMINQLHPGLFAYKFLTALYLNHNNLTSLPPIIAQLQNLQILNVTGNKLSSLPIELSMVVSLRELLLYDNQLTFIPPEYGQLYQLEMLGLEGNPMSEPIASMIIEKGTSVVIKYLRDSCPYSFTIMSYNTLCEKYVSPQLYGYTPSWALAWDYRKDLLLQEILNYSADIICLQVRAVPLTDQEVDQKQYEEFFKEQLSQLSDYDGVFFPKSRSRTMGEIERRQVDGCATLYKTSK